MDSAKAQNRNERSASASGLRAGRQPSRRGQPLAARFWARVEKRAPDECWPWLGYVDRDGYGRFQHGFRRFGAHKVSLELKLGRALRADEVSRHLCHNPRCCNPRHLEAGSQADNVRDTVAAGHTRKGEDNHAVLTEAQVVEIRERYAKGEHAISIAPDYGVSDRMVGKIAQGFVWQHVGGPISPTRRPNRKHFDRATGQLVPASQRAPRPHHPSQDEVTT